jgi:short-subunit dehydrogenase
MRKLESVRGLTALVTGASSGIGRGLALGLAERGARVALVARRADRLESLAAEIRGKSGEALVLPCDVADRGEAAASAARALDHFGAVDLLVNNAGYGHHRRFLDWDLEDMERVMRVNYFGALYFTKALLPPMVERGRGWLLFVSSVAGRIASAGEAAYAASKFAMAGLAQALSMEVEDAGVHVLTVYPGVFRTEFFDEEALERMPPVSRRSMAEPEVLVQAIFKALAAGRRELTVPRYIEIAYRLQALAPGLSRRSTKRITVAALEQGRAGRPG